MRYYQDVLQPTEDWDKCPVCKSATCHNAPTVKEKERSKVLQISRDKMTRCNRRAQAACDESWRRKTAYDTGLEKSVLVRNTLRKLERDISEEIMAALGFSRPVPMG
jgi:hypothetical protein